MSTAAQPQQSTSTNPLSSSARRPTTPLRRISASSLRSLSRSQSHAPGATQPLAHLTPLFQEFKDAAADLAGNLQGLQELQQKLEGFNEAFAGYLYGIRMNAYAVDFNEAPSKINFELAAQRAPVGLATEQLSSPPPQQHQVLSDPEEGDTTHQAANDTTQNGPDYSFMPGETRAASAPATRGRGGASVRGGRGRGGKVVLTKRQEVELKNWAHGLIDLLPIAIREKEAPRKETEAVLCKLRDYPNGTTMAELVKVTKLIQSKVNNSLVALVGAKMVIKTAAKPSTTFTLDPARYTS